MSRRDAGGSSNSPLCFPSAAPQELCGVRVEAKLCELCGRMFFRDAQQKECGPCAAKLAQPKEPVPEAMARDGVLEIARRAHLRKAWERRRARMMQLPVRTDGATSTISIQ